MNEKTFFSVMNSPGIYIRSSARIRWKPQLCFQRTLGSDPTDKMMVGSVKLPFPGTVGIQLSSLVGPQYALMIMHGVTS